MTQEPQHEWHIIRWPSGPDAEADTYPWTGPTTPDHTFEVFKQTETPNDPQEGFKISHEKTFSSENEAWAYYDENNKVIDYNLNGSGGILEIAESLGFKVQDDDPTLTEHERCSIYDAELDEAHDFLLEQGYTIKNY